MRALLFYIVFCAASVASTPAQVIAQKARGKGPVRGLVKGAFRVQVLYDLYNGINGAYQLPAQRDTLINRDSVMTRKYDYEEQQAAPNPYPYQVYNTGNVRLPTLRRGGYEVLLSKQLQRILRQDYLNDRQATNQMQSSDRRAAKPANTRSWAWSDITKVVLLTTPLHDSLVNIRVERGYGGPARNSEDSTYIFRLKAGRIRLITDRVLWEENSRFSGKDLGSLIFHAQKKALLAHAMKEYPGDEVYKTEDLLIRDVELVERGVDVHYSLCYDMPNYPGEIDCDHSHLWLTIPYRALPICIFGRATR